MTYREFLIQCRSIDADRPRAADGHILKVFRSMFPDTPLHEDWTVHDAYIVISYHLYFQDLTAGGNPIGEKTRTNFKAAKIMLKDLDRGRAMLSDTTKSIHNVLLTTFKESQVKNAKAAEVKAAAKAKEAEAFPAGEKKAKEAKVAKPTATKVVCQLVTENKWTDAQIAAKASELVGREINTGCVSTLRASLNAGLREGTGFPQPKTPFLEIGGDKAKAEAKPAPKSKAEPAKAKSTMPVPVKTKTAPAPAAKPPVKAAPAPVAPAKAAAAPVKKVAPVAKKVA